MPNKLTDNETKKALECCIKSSHFGECFENECPLVSEEGCKVGKETLYPYALDLINRQEEKLQEAEDTIQYADKEIKRLNAENEVLERRNTTLEKLAEHRKKAIFERVERNLELRKELKTANAEIESLKAEVERLQSHIQEGIDLAKQIPEMLALVKAEAYKEFVEKVKEKSNKTELVCSGALVRTDFTITKENLDNLLKELERKESTTYDD